MADTAKLTLEVDVKDLASRSLKSIGASVSSLGKVAAVGLGVGLAGATAGIAGLGVVLKESIASARDSNKVMAQTEAAIKSTGGAAGFTAQQISDMAGALSAAAGKSLFGDDDIQQGQNLLLTFTNIKDTLPDATKVMVDMAQAMGTDVKGGAIQLGKALNDPIKGISALSRVGVTFTDQQKKQIEAMVKAGHTADAQRVILKELNKEFGGSAAAAAVADGGFAQLQDQLGELAEGMGKQLMPAVTKFMSLLTGPVVQGGLQFFADALTSVIGTAIDWLTGTALPGIRGFVQDARKWFDLMGGGGDGVGAVVQLIINKVGELVPSLQPVTEFLSSNFWPAWEAGERAIGIVRDAITTFIQAYQGDWQNSDGILLIHQVFGELGIAVGIARDAVLTFIAAYNGDWQNSDGILLIHQAFGELGLILAGTVVPAIQSAVSWLQQNAGWLSQVALAVGGAIVAFQAITAIVGVVTGVMGALGVALGVVLSPIGLIAIAVGALALAWQTNFGNIQGIVAGAWAAIQPVFAQVVAWLGTNIPAATAALASFWNSTLLPALQTAGAFITGTLIPTLVTLVSGGLTLVGAAVTTLAGFWTGTLQPALQAVWGFISGSIVPLLTALANVAIAAVTLALTVMAGIWQNVLLPALQAVWGFISSSLSPGIQVLADFFTGTLNPAVNSAGSTLNTVLGPAVQAITGFFNRWYTAIGGVSGAIQTAIGWLNSLATKLGSVKLPWWMTPGSPTPWENGLRGAGDAAKATAKDTEVLAKSLSKIAPVAGKGGTSPADPIVDMINKLADAVSKGVDALGKLGAFKAVSQQTMTAFAVNLKSLVGTIEPALHAFKAKALAAAAELADSAGKLVGLAGTTADTLAKLQDFHQIPDKAIGAFAANLKVLISAIVDAVHKFRAEALEAAAGLADDATKLVSLASASADTLGKLVDFHKVPLKAISTFAANLQALISAVETAVHKFKLDGLKAAAELADSASKMVSIAGAGADALSKLQDFHKVPLKAINTFANNLKDLVSAMEAALHKFRADMLKTVAPLADDVTKLLGPIGTALDAFAKLEDFRRVPEKALTTFAAMLKATISKMIDLAGQFKTDGVAAAAVFGDAVGRIIAPIGAAVDAFDKLRGYKSFASKLFALLGSDIGRAVDLMSSLAEKFKGPGLAAASAFATTAGVLADGIGRVVDALTKVRDYKGISGDTLSKFFGDLQAIMTQSAQLSSVGFVDVWKQSFELLAPDMALALQTSLQDLTDNTIRPWLLGQLVVLRDGGARMINALAAGISGASGSATGAASHLGADIAAALQSGFGHPTLTFTIVGSGGGSGTAFFPGGGTSTPGTRPTLPVGTPPATAPPSANSFRSVAANAGGGSGGGATLSIGSITIIQQPGEDAGALADRLFPTILDRWDREMRKRGRR